MSDGMLSLSEVEQYLDVDKKKIDELIEQGKLDAYKIGGSFLRFKKEQVLVLCKHVPKKSPYERSFFDRIKDFWGFYGFYILSALILSAVLYWLFK